MAQENCKSLGRYTTNHEHHHKEDPKITTEDSWNERNEDDHEEACLMAVESQKQTTLAISIIKADYVAAERACKQALWMKQAIKDYDIYCEDVLVFCDNKGAIDLSKNSVHHSRTKHIKIRDHSLRDKVQKGYIIMEKVASKDNSADILTKPLKRETFNHLRLGLRMLRHEE
ncbi:hypothetical protein Tco_0385901 [Tanacetum coccineum]